MGTHNLFLNKMLRIFLFYILLQTATGAKDYGYERGLDDAQDLKNNDRLAKHKKYNEVLSNLHGLFKRRSEDNVAKENANDHNENSMALLKKHDKIQFDKLIGDVTRSLDKIKEQLIKFNNEGLLTVEIPAVDEEKRHKREISNETLTEIFVDDNSTESIEITTENTDSVAEKVEPITVVPETFPDKEVPRTGNDTDVTVNSRRMIPGFVQTNSRVKDKLLNYLEDTFNEVERKIKPLTNIKIALSNDDHYRIGYIIATIDTLEVNLKKLKTDMNLHQQTWGDEKILDLFDRIKATNTVTTTLIETLKKYLPKHN